MTTAIDRRSLAMYLNGAPNSENLPADCGQTRLIHTLPPMNVARPMPVVGETPSNRGRDD